MIAEKNYLLTVKWTVYPQSAGRFYVDEQTGPLPGPMMRYGPLPSRTLAEALVEERKKHYKLVEQQLLNARTLTPWTVPPDAGMAWVPAASLAALIRAARDVTESPYAVPHSAHVGALRRTGKDFEDAIRESLRRYRETSQPMQEVLRALGIPTGRGPNAGP